MSMPLSYNGEYSALLKHECGFDSCQGRQQGKLIMRFILDNANDIIQECWARGVFYEQDELEKISKYLNSGLTYLDVGANIGNHCIYFDKILKANKVYVIEPFPRAYKLLLENAALNYCHSINFDYLGLLFGDKEATYTSSNAPRDNLGNTEFYESANGNFKCITGDSIFENIKLDFIKIDVENMEKEVLAGLAKTIEYNRPIMYVEVRAANYEWFKDWLVQNNYSVLEVLTTFNDYTNLLVVSNKEK